MGNTGRNIMNGIIGIELNTLLQMRVVVLCGTVCDSCIRVYRTWKIENGTKVYRNQNITLIDLPPLFQLIDTCRFRIAALIARIEMNFPINENRNKSMSQTSYDS